MKCILTLLDIIGIRKYIFASNRLREKIDGLELLELPIKRWTCDMNRRING